MKIFISIFFILIALMIIQSLPEGKGFLESIIIALPFYFLFFLITDEVYSYSTNNIRKICLYFIIFVSILLFFYLIPYSISIEIATATFFVNDINNSCFPIKGIDALDQTSIAGFIGYGVFLLVVSAFILRYFFVRDNKCFTIITYILLFLTLGTSLLFLLSSTFLLGAYVYIMGWTFCRFCGFIYLAINFITCFFIVRKL